MIRRETMILPNQVDVQFEFYRSHLEIWFSSDLYTDNNGYKNCKYCMIALIDGNDLDDYLHLCLNGTSSLYGHDDDLARFILSSLKEHLS